MSLWKPCCERRSIDGIEIGTDLNKLRHLSDNQHEFEY